MLDQEAQGHLEELARRFEHIQCDLAVNSQRRRVAVIESQQASCLEVVKLLPVALDTKHVDRDVRRGALHDTVSDGSQNQHIGGGQVSHGNSLFEHVFE